MAKKEGFLNISIAWKEDEFGNDYVTPEMVFDILPDGVNANVYVWDDEEPAPDFTMEGGYWVMVDQNWEDDDAESN